MMTSMMMTVTAGALHALALAPMPEPGTESTAPGWTAAVPMVLMLVMFYFLLIRPQQKRMKEHEKLLSAVEAGDEVITAGGILGTVTSKRDKTVTVRIADGVKVEVLLSAITSVTKPDGKTSSVQ